MESALYGIYALVVFVLVRKYRTPWLSMKSFLFNNIIIASRGLRPGSKVCSEHMNDWRHLSLRDLVQREISPPPKMKVFLCLNVWLWCLIITWQVTWPKIEKEGNWRIYFVWINKLAFLKEDKHTYLSTFGMNVREV